MYIFISICVYRNIYKYSYVFIKIYIDILMNICIDTKDIFRYIRIIYIDLFI